MATVQIANIFNPSVWLQQIVERMTNTNAFSRSGIAVHDAALTTLFSAGGNVATLPFYGPIGTTEPRLSNDTYAATDALTHDNITTKQMTVALCARNWSWSMEDLARAIASEDPAGAITSQIGDYWGVDNQARLISSLKGILADNVANDNHDMLKDISIDTSDALTAANKISGVAIIDALQTMGDAKNALGAIAVHSMVHSRMQKNNLIDAIPTASADIGFGTYLQKTLIVDDTLPVDVGSNHTAYTCVLFGRGAVAEANRAEDVPLEMVRQAASGNGGGGSRIYSRICNVFHPLGFSFSGGAQASRTTLETAGSWNRVVARKKIPIAFLKVNEDGL